MKSDHARTPEDWEEIRNEHFPTHALAAKTGGPIDFTLMAQAPTAESVATIIRHHAQELNSRGLTYAAETNPELQEELFEVIQRYFGGTPETTALTWNTTLGLAQFYGGIRMTSGQEMLTSHNEHFCTLEAIRLRARREGMPYRQVPLYRDSASVTRDEILANIEAGLRPSTRVLAMTWVSSSDGVKLPIATIAELVALENSRRGPDVEQLLLVVDGVHGFGVENSTFDGDGGLGCDLFAAGCHKWMFGPRGTAVVIGTAAAWSQVIPWIPTFTKPRTGPARPHLPGGLKTFEHIWALRETFEFMLSLGKPQIQARVYALATYLKEGLLEIPHVDLRTPVSQELSSGIISFDVERLKASAAIVALKNRNILVTESGWDATAGRTHVRVSVTFLNTEEQVDELLHVVRNELPAAARGAD